MGAGRGTISVADDGKVGIPEAELVGKLQVLFAKVPRVEADAPLLSAGAAPSFEKPVDDADVNTPPVHTFLLCTNVLKPSFQATSSTNRSLRFRLLLSVHSATESGLSYLYGSGESCSGEEGLDSRSRHDVVASMRF